jgi:hypothetical protein
MANEPAADNDAVHLVGAPRQLTFSGSVLPAGESCELVLPPSLQSYADRPVMSLPIRKRRGGEGRLRLRLADATPPGHYAAEMRIAGKAYPVALDIHPLQRLSISPGSADFQGKPGASAAAEMSLTNHGNVPIIVPETAIVMLNDDQAIEAAFADGVCQDSDDALVVVGYLLRGLRAGYSGPLKLLIAEGAGSVEPGQRRTLKVTTNIPKKLTPGHSYDGIWEIGPLRHRVNVSVQS